MKTVLRTHVAAAMLLLPLSAALLATPAAAQQRSSVYTISQLNVRNPGGLVPGGMLFVSVIAAAGATEASVTLGTGGPQVPLQEQSPGAYTGQYAVQAGDRIDANQPITVRVQWAGQPTATRAYPFPSDIRTAAAQQQRPPAATRPPEATRPGRPAPTPAPVAVAPAIERFAVEPGGRIVAGRKLQFRLAGTPRATATVEIPGVVRGLALRETARGVYEGSYTVRSGDRASRFDSAVATLREGKLSSTAKLDLKASIDDRRDRDEPRGDRPDGPRGDRPDGPRGDGRDGPRGEGRGERPDGAGATPRGDRPAGPRGDDRNDRPSGTRGDDRGERPGGAASTPRTERPAPAASTPRAPAPAASAPRAERPTPAASTPRAERPTPSASTPRAERPAPAASTPRAERPADGASGPRAERPAGAASGPRGDRGERGERGERGDRPAGARGEGRGERSADGASAPRGERRERTDGTSADQAR